MAVINGFALGGGFEVTLACDYRVMSTRAQVGLPEVKLGLFPGWGGTVRLPRLIGIDNAIEWIGLGKQQRSDDALKIGAVDAVVEPELLIDAARDILRQCNEDKLDYRSRRREKREPVRLNEVERTMVFSTSEAYVAAKAGPHYPAPGIALKAMKKHVTLPRDEASEVEAAAFAEVFKTDAARSLVGPFPERPEPQAGCPKVHQAGHGLSNPPRSWVRESWVAVSPIRRPTRAFPSS